MKRSCHKIKEVNFLGGGRGVTMISYNRVFKIKVSGQCLLRKIGLSVTIMCHNDELSSTMS